MPHPSRAAVALRPSPPSPSITFHQRPSAPVGGRAAPAGGRPGHRSRTAVLSFLRAPIIAGPTDEPQPPGRRQELRGPPHDAPPPLSKGTSPSQQTPAPSAAPSAPVRLEPRRGPVSQFVWCACRQAAAGGAGRRASRVWRRGSLALAAARIYPSAPPPLPQNIRSQCLAPRRGRRG